MSERQDVAWRDIGEGVEIELRYIGARLHGIAYRHPVPYAATGRCEGYIDFGPDGWTIESLDPLTVSPSLLCRGCGHHGFIRDGKWVPT